MLPKASSRIIKGSRHVGENWEDDEEGDEVIEADSDDGEVGLRFTLQDFCRTEEDFQFYIRKTMEWSEQSQQRSAQLPPPPPIDTSRLRTRKNP